MMLLLKKISEIRTLALLFIFSVSIFSSPVHASNGFFGIEPGIGIGAGTAEPLDSGVVLGATAGYEFNPDFGFAVTYQHSKLGVTNTDNTENISQIFLEANAFSYLLLHGGIHLGDVITNVNGNSTGNLGVGLHVGFDLRVTERLTAGLAAYWTYVDQTADKHSLYSLVVPLKVWF